MKLEMIHPENGISNENLGLILDPKQQEKEDPVINHQHVKVLCLSTLEDMYTYNICLTYK